MSILLMKRHIEKLNKDIKSLEGVTLIRKVFVDTEMVIGEEGVQKKLKKLKSLRNLLRVMLINRFKYLKS